MGCASLLAHSIPSPGWFRASRCLHRAASIFDPLALAPGPAGRPRGDLTGLSLSVLAFGWPGSPAGVWPLPAVPLCPPYPVALCAAR